MPDGIEAFINHPAFPTQRKTKKKPKGRQPQGVTVGYLIDMLTDAVDHGRCGYDTVVEVSVPMGGDETPFRRIFAGLAGDLNCNVTCMILCEQGEDNEDCQ